MRISGLRFNPVPHGSADFRTKNEREIARDSANKTKLQTRSAR